MLCKKQGSTFLIIVGILAVIAFISTAFFSSTVQEGRQTHLSVRGLHSTSLAEAALERAMVVLSSNVNRVDPDDSSADDIGILLRLPAQALSGQTLGLEGSLGADDLLELPAELQQEIVFTKDDLQGDFGDELDFLVNFMTLDGATDYEVEVRVTIDKAFRIAPGSNYVDYQVPGVDIPWNLRPDVESFLNGDGYSPIEIRFPDGFSLFRVMIPISIGPITLVNINVTSIIDRVLPSIPIGGQNRSFQEITSLDFIADQILNRIISPNRQIYPLNITFDRFSDALPSTVEEMWPAGVNIDGSIQEQYLEKYGQLRLESTAVITYQDGYSSTRRITAYKDFKVADCEPVAPMYSFFLANFENDYIDFNNYGGQFVVTNSDLSGVFSRIREVVTGQDRQLTDEELRQREVPGLIRVNYYDESDDKGNPLICNVGLIGDWNAPQIQGDDSGIVKRLLGGFESPIMLSARQRMSIAGGRVSLNAQVTQRSPTNPDVRVPIDWTGGGGENPTPIFAGGFSNMGLERLTVADAKWTGMNFSEYLRQRGPGNINMIPQVSRMGCNILAFTASMALKPIGDAVVSRSIAAVPDVFFPGMFDMPFMGTRNSLFTLPTTGTASNKTSLFGSSGLAPTMTREIEGNVLKRFRRWNMVIIGMRKSQRLPLLPFPPVFLPPIPIPIWHTQEILNKYGYELPAMAAIGEDGEADQQTHEYDPRLLQNAPPNLYTVEQYAKKATYYYESGDEFISDLPNRMIEVNGESVFLLNGITFVSGTIGTSDQPFTVDGGELKVLGRGMIVTTGNMFLGCDIRVVDRSEEDTTIFSLILREGGLIVMDPNRRYDIEASVYTDKGIAINGNSSLHIMGNWVTNEFSKPAMSGTVNVTYVSSRTRTSFGSLHPERGRFDPRRYHVSFSPTWSSWRAH